MKIRHRCAPLVPVLAILSIAGTAGSAVAQESKGTPAAAVAAATPTEAKAVFEKARAAYKGAKTYQDKVKLTFELKAKTPDGQDQSQSDTESMTFVFAGPRKFAVTHNDFGVYSSGEKQTAHVKFLGQYIERPASDQIIDEAGSFGPIGILTFLHVPSTLLIAPAKFEKQFPVLSEVTGVAPEKLNGVPGKRVAGMGELPDKELENKIPMTIWFSDETGMVGEVTVDLRPMYAEVDGGEMKIDKAEAILSFSDIQVNSEVPADAYTFKAGPSDRKVERFEDSVPDPQQALVGKPSPDFKGMDLDGKPLNLSDFKGKVVLLDFWATTCGYCMQFIPKVQELSTEYADKGLVVIGMNSDEEGSKEKVKEAVAKKKLTFRHFMDPVGDVSEQFLISGIPCLMLIDQEGVIQWIHTGAAPGLKKEIAEKVEKLLKGESIVEKTEPTPEPAPPTPPAPEKK